MTGLIAWDRLVKEESKETCNIIIEKLKLDIKCYELNIKNCKDEIERYNKEVNKL